MNAEIEQALSRSQASFRDLVWPVIAPHVGGGILEPVESVTSEGFVKILDTLSGIDAWQVIQGCGVRGIASRVQTYGDMQTFTVRLRTRYGSDETEFAKINRLTRIWSKGFLSAGLVVQAYLAHSACAYIVRAQDFYPRIRNENQGQRRTYNECDGGLWFEQKVRRGEVMAVFPVEALRQDGCDVLRVALPESAPA